MLTVDDAMRRAIALATSPDAPRGPNPRVGCVLLDGHGLVVGEGYHHGAGTPHAEIEALARAGAAARGATAVVSLEPCSHTGRTGPCTQALIEAGVVRVVYAQSDPTDLAGGGAAVLREAGLEVVGGVLGAEAAAVNRAWTHVQQTGWPFITLKTAMSLDGRVAGASGGPTAITGGPARELSHALRATVDAILVGTGTAVVDDPRLTARDCAGELRAQQPLRVVMGTRTLPPELHLFDDSATTLVLATHDPVDVVKQLGERGVQHLLVEGGPTISAAFLEADLVDELVWFIAPRFLGAGPVSLPALSTQRDVNVGEVRVVGDDVVLFCTLDHVGA